jgi:predicted anti-sigma-YlaC factor YlaD
MANGDRSKHSEKPLVGTENAIVREIIETYERRRWLRERADIWARWALAIIPIAITIYVTWQARGGR